MDLTDRIAVWQQNVNKSRICQHGLVSNNDLIRKGINIIALQEPSIDANGYTLASKDWVPIYPTLHRKSNAATRAVTLIRESIKSDTWKQIDFPSCDVVVIQISGEWGKLTIANIYNDCHNDETVRLLKDFHNRNQAEITQTISGTAHTLWVGDFNRHHPYWDDPSDGRLFTNEATDAAKRLIEAVADIGLELALPSGIPTHRHSVTKLWSRLDQVFISDCSINALISCETQPDHWGVNTDHLPILTVLNLKAEHVVEQEIPNFRDVDWEEFQKELSTQLDKIPAPSTITSQSQLNRACESLTKALQRTIEFQVPTATITPKSKRWWTKELTQLRRRANKLGRQSYNRHSDPDHLVHSEHIAAAKKYRKTLEQTKNHHWRDWLENAEDPDIWTAHKLTSNPWGDGGKTRIPGLKQGTDGDEIAAVTNSDKG